MKIGAQMTRTVIPLVKIEMKIEMKWYISIGAANCNTETQIEMSNGTVEPFPGPELEPEAAEVAEHERGAVAEYVEARFDRDVIIQASLEDLSIVPSDGRQVADQKCRVLPGSGDLASDVGDAAELFFAVVSGYGGVLNNLHVQSVVLVLVRISEMGVFIRASLGVLTS